MSEVEHPSDTKRFEMMREMINSNGEKTIVDIGGGFYPISDGLTSKETLVIDGDEEFEPDILADLNGPLRINNNSADIIIAGEILEHLINPFRFLIECNRVLKLNGELILSTPNAVDLKSRIKVLFGGLPTNGARAFPTTDDHYFFHKTEWNWKLLINLLEQAGFKIRLKKTNGLYFGKYQILSENKCPLVFGEKMIVLATKSQRRQK